MIWPFFFFFSYVMVKYHLYWKRFFSLRKTGLYVGMSNLYQVKGEDKVDEIPDWPGTEKQMEHRRRKDTFFPWCTFIFSLNMQV